MRLNNCRELKVWQASMELAQQIYRLTTNFPKEETYGLVSQIRRAAVSIPSNIAEGHTRESTKEFLHHISVSLGSFAELETQFILSGKLGYVEAQTVDSILLKLDEAGKMLRGFQKSLKSKLSNG